MGACGSNHHENIIFATEFERAIERAYVNKGPKTINDLFDEILVMIFEYCEPRERLLAVRFVCVRWMHLIMYHPRLRPKRTLTLKHCKLGPNIEPAKVFMNRYLEVNKLIIGSNVNYFKGLDKFWRSLGGTATHILLSNEAVKYFFTHLYYLEHFNKVQTLKIDISDHQQWQVVNVLSESGRLKHLRVIIDPYIGCYQKCILNHDKFKLSHSTNLKSLELDCFNICERCLLAIIQSYPTLIDFSIFGVEKFHNNFIQELARNLPRLSELTIHCSKTHQIANVFQSWPIMTDLKRFKCAYLNPTEPDIAFFCRRCPYVTELVILFFNCEMLTVALLNVVAVKLKNLKVLHMEATMGEVQVLDGNALSACKLLKILVLPNFEIHTDVKRLLFIQNRGLEKIVSMKLTETNQLKTVTLRRTFFEDLKKNTND